MTGTLRRAGVGLMSIGIGLFLGGCTLNAPPQSSAQPTGLTTPAASDQRASTPSVDNQRPVITLVTSKGKIEIRLFSDETPKTVKNFISKARAGFYDGLVFHRVESWVIQGGDPKGDGTGGGTMRSELTDHPFAAGSVGVARGSDRGVSNDAQFFICTADCSWLTGEYTNFGEVVSGMDVASMIAAGDQITTVDVSQ